LQRRHQLVAEVLWRTTTTVKREMLQRVVASWVLRSLNVVREHVVTKTKAKAVGGHVLWWENTTSWTYRSRNSYSL